MTKGADFLAEMRKLDIEVDPLAGEQVSKLVARMLDVPPSVRERAKLAFGRL